MGRRPKETFLQRRNTYGQQEHGKMFNITNYQQEMQIRITVRYHLMPVRMAIKSTNNKFQRGCGETGTILHCWQECKLVQLLQKRVWKFLRKLKIELHMIQQSHPRHISRQNCNSKIYMPLSTAQNSSIHSITIHNSQDMETT